VHGGSFHAELHGEIDPSNLTPPLGGTYEGDCHVTFEFDTSDGGLLHCPAHVRIDLDRKVDGEGAAHVTVDVQETRATEEATESEK
jgi:hypothetical protein